MATKNLEDARTAVCGLRVACDDGCSRVVVDQVVTLLRGRCERKEIADLEIDLRARRQVRRFGVSAHTHEIERADIWGCIRCITHTRAASIATGEMSSPVVSRPRVAAMRIASYPYTGSSINIDTNRANLYAYSTTPRDERASRLREVYITRCEQLSEGRLRLASIPRRLLLLPGTSNRQTSLGQVVGCSCVSTKPYPILAPGPRSAAPGLAASEVRVLRLQHSLP